MSQHSQPVISHTVLCYQVLYFVSYIYDSRFSVFLKPSSVPSYDILYELPANIIHILFIFKIYSITNISYARFCYTDSAVYCHPILKHSKQFNLLAPEFGI